MAGTVAAAAPAAAPPAGAVERARADRAHAHRDVDPDRGETVAGGDRDRRRRVQFEVLEDRAGQGGGRSACSRQ